MHPSFALFALMFSYTAEWSVAAAFSLNAAAAAVAASFVAALAVITPPRVVITIRAAKKTESNFFAFFICFLPPVIFITLFIKQGVAHSFIVNNFTIIH